MELGGLVFGLLASIAVASGIVFTIRKSAPHRRSLPVTANWIEEVSIEQYRPMLRLLDTEELRALRSQPDCTPVKIAEIRRERCRLFREYLETLRGDFGRICLALKLLLVQVENDRPDLASILIRSQLQFACGVALVELRLALYSCGIGTVEAASLLRVFEGLRLELHALVPSGTMAA